MEGGQMLILIDERGKKWRKWDWQGGRRRWWDLQEMINFLYFICMKVIWRIRREEPGCVIVTNERYYLLRLWAEQYSSNNRKSGHQGSITPHLLSSQDSDTLLLIQAESGWGPWAKAWSPGACRLATLQDLAPGCSLSNAHGFLFLHVCQGYTCCLHTNSLWLFFCICLARFGHARPPKNTWHVHLKTRVV